MRINDRLRAPNTPRRGRRSRRRRARCSRGCSAAEISLEPAPPGQRAVHAARAGGEAGGRRHTARTPAELRPGTGFGIRVRIRSPRSEPLSRFTSTPVVWYTYVYTAAPGSVSDPDAHAVGERDVLVRSDRRTADDHRHCARVRAQGDGAEGARRRRSGGAARRFPGAGLGARPRGRGDSREVQRRRDAALGGHRRAAARGARRRRSVDGASRCSRPRRSRIRSSTSAPTRRRTSGCRSAPAATFPKLTAALVEPNMDFDATALGCRARKEGGGYVLDGKKCFVPNGSGAETFLVYAREGEGEGFETVQAFIVPRSAAGRERRREGKEHGRARARQRRAHALGREAAARSARRRRARASISSAS